MEILLPEYKRLLSFLNLHKVNYMLIGGYAVIYYGYERNTTDMDVWLKPENANRDKLLLALRDYGIKDNSLEKLALVDFAEAQFFFIGERPMRIDFLTHINNVIFEDAEKEMQYLPCGDEQIPVIQYHHLILSKIANNRPQDIADVDRLQQINKYKNSNK